MIRRLSARLSHTDWLPLLCVACFLLAGPKPAHAFKPEDPEVRTMVDRGVRYLEGLSEEQIKTAQWGGGDGQVILVAYAHLKAEHNVDAPIIKLGLKNAMFFVSDVKKNNGNLTHGVKTLYEVAVAILFLAELDAVGYKDELRSLGLGMAELQMTHGGYGYPKEPNGDVSMTQYVALAMWTLDRAGVELPLNRVKSMVSWLARVQDVSGSWPYKGEDPGPGKPLKVQPAFEMSLSTSLAGGSSILIASDIFRVWGRNTKGDNGVEGLPKALKILEQESLQSARIKQAPLPRDAILGVINRLDGYRKQNTIKRTSQVDWYYYMLYTLERYESFMELAIGKTSQSDWYDEGVRSLMSLQDSTGAWGVKDKSWNEPPACTAFAVLFLIRSTKKSIGAALTGSLAGGYLLPKDTTKIVLDGTQIKGEPAAAAVTDLLDLLEGDNAVSADESSIPENLKLETDPARRRIQLARLERLVRGSNSWQARRVAARLLGQSDDLSVVPSLIFAISDRDTKTRAYALDGLQFISRRFSDFGVTKVDGHDNIRRTQQAWVSWYKTIYPNYIFLDDGL